MIKKYILMLLFVLIQITSLKSQDIIVLNSGREIKSKIIEIEEYKILYRNDNSIANAINTFPTDSIFMVIYKNGHREMFLSKINNEKKLSQENNSNNTFLKNNNFEVILVKEEKITDKKNKYNTIKTNVKVIRNNVLFTNLDITATQVKDKPLKYDEINGAYYFKSNISIYSDKYSPLLFQKYESFYGRGYGWALAPNFFSDYSTFCSVAFLSQKGYNREMRGMGGLVVHKIFLPDCSSLEKKILSIALVWLDENFIKK